MKNLKLLIISIVVLLIAILTGCKSMQIDYMEDNADGPKQVRQGQDINPREITVWAIYKDGSRKTVPIAQNNITFNKHTPGPQTVKIRVQNQEVSFVTEVMALRSLTITSQPRVLLFKEGQEPDPSWPGLEIRGEWDQMGSDRIALSYCEITGFMKDQPGPQTIKVSYEGQQTSFDVTVRSMASLNILQPPTKLDYFQGESLNLAGLVVRGVWGDGIPDETLTITRNDVAGFNGNTAGIQHLTITKNGRSANFDVEVMALSSIVLEKPPTKTDYYAGEALDLTGIEVTGNYTGADPTKRRSALIPIDQLTTSGYEPNRIGRQQRVTVIVRGISANFFVNITEAPPAPVPAPTPTPTPTPEPAPTPVPDTPDPLTSNKAFERFTALQVRDTQRSPAYPVNGASMTLSDFKAPFYDRRPYTNIARINTAGAYFQLSWAEGATDNNLILALNLYNSSGAVIESIAAQGRIVMFFKEGFLYIGNAADVGYIFFYEAPTGSSLRVTSFTAPTAGDFR